MKSKKSSGLSNNLTRVLTLASLIALLLLIYPDLIAQRKAGSGPNIVFILADDLGYGDLSCYGQKHFRTPNIDRLAEQGMKFTNHYSGSPVCAPSRSTLMTGLHSGHTFVRGNKEVKPEGQWPLPRKAYTITEMLKSAGYVTGAFGKWGLGFPGSEGAPHNQGVDHFFGYNCQRLAHNYYPAHLWDNEKKIALAGNEGIAKNDYAPEFIHQKALEFIEINKDNSFFLFYPMITPHAELVAPERYMAMHRDKFLPEKNYDGIDAGEKDFRTGPYGSQPESHAAFAAMISVMDEQVGSVIEKIEALGLSENTIIIFSSDNGPHVEGGADPDFFNSNGILRGYKRDVYEGGIRVPLIARWTGHIQAGAVSDHVSAFWDAMPTFAQLANARVKGKIDGISYLPTLMGHTEKQKQHEHLYWEFHERGGRLALRQGNWKLIQYNAAKEPHGKFELYNLADDPSESNDLSEKFPEKVKELTEILHAEHKPSRDFPFGAEGR